MILLIYLILIASIITNIWFIIKLDQIDRKGDYEKNKGTYTKRIKIALVYLILGITLSYWNRLPEIISEIKNGLFNDQIKFIWCVSVTLVGASLGISQHRFTSNFSWLPYLIFYPIIIGLIATLVYSYLTIQSIEGYIFYIFSAALCLTLSLFIDNFREMFPK